MSLFSRKTYKLITMTGKKWGACALWWAIVIFQLTELNVKATNVFNMRVHEGACARMLNDSINSVRAEGMRNANVRNHVKHPLNSLDRK